jgi:hypothetical protein
MNYIAPGMTAVPFDTTTPPSCRGGREARGGGGLGTVKPNSGAQFEISIDGVPRTHRDRKDIALQSAQFLKSRNPHSVVKLRDLQTGEETVVVFKAGSD